MAVMLRRYRFTVDEYERLAEIGVPAHCDRVELLDGEIVEMSPIGTHHASVVARRHEGRRQSRKRAITSLP